MDDGRNAGKSGNNDGNKEEFKDCSIGQSSAVKKKNIFRVHK